MKDKQLAVVVVTIPLDEPRDSSMKLDVAVAALDQARTWKDQLVALPAGLLLGTTEAEAKRRARALVRAARARKVGVVFGIDSPKKRSLVAWAPGMASESIWSTESTEPQVLQLGRFRVCVLSETQAEDAASRTEAVRRQPDLVVLCAHLSFTKRWRVLERFRRLDVPIVPATYALDFEIPPLVCPRGYRLPNLSFNEQGTSFTVFRIDELDGPLRAA